MNNHNDLDISLDRLNGLMRYMLARGTGYTTALKKGVNADEHCFVLVPTIKHGHMLGFKNPIAYDTHTWEKMVGCREPILIDNSALNPIFYDINTVTVGLKGQLAREKTEHGLLMMKYVKLSSELALAIEEIEQLKRPWWKKLIDKLGKK